MSTHYTVYGLTLRCGRQIPGLTPCRAVPKAAEVEVLFGSLPQALEAFPSPPQELTYASPFVDEQGEPLVRVWRMRREPYFRLRYADGTEFVVARGGTQVWSRWPETLTLEDATTYLVGPVLGFVLRLRGITCLHASSVAVDGQAVIFLGPAGAGKSTTAAALAQRGYAVLGDDIVALWPEGEGFLVPPGCPRLQLWPESAQALLGTRSLPRHAPSWDKRYLDLTAGGYEAQSSPLPLGAAYLLGERVKERPPSITPTSGRTAFVELLTHTYATRLIGRNMRAREFGVLGQVVSQVPLRRMTPQANLADLGRLCELILDDLEAMRWRETPLPVACRRGGEKAG